LQRAEWGHFYLSAPSSANHQAGENANVRRQFAETGKLSGDIDEQFRPVEDRTPVCAFSYAFEPLDPSSSASSVRVAVFSAALLQDPMVQFASARGLTQMRPLWKSYFSNASELLRYHLADYATAFSLAANYSAQLAQDTLASADAHQGYVDIVALSARQVFGATQFGSTPDDPLLFLKEISSNGNMQTVDVIFPPFPFFLYTNPHRLAYLLQPLLEYQLSGQYPNNYSIHDLGSHFPNATGHADGADEYMPVEECGNMLIMALALAHALKSPAQQAPFAATGAEPPLKLPSQPNSAVASTGGEKGSGISLIVDEFGMNGGSETSPALEARTWLARHYKLWRQWTGYLVRESLVPANQVSTDDFAGWLANQTNLALKGIIGIRAMSEIATMVGPNGQGAEYRRTAEEYVDKWVGYGISSDGTHAKLAYT
jgi:hypothetical protein